MSPAELSRYTLQYIDRAPMFHPLDYNTIIPTGTSGITPTGVYLATHPNRDIQSTQYAMRSPKCEAKLGSPPVCNSVQCGKLNVTNPMMVNQEGGHRGPREQKGGEMDDTFYYPADYPGHFPNPYSPEYIGVTCGSSCGPVCGNGLTLPNSGVLAEPKPPGATRCKVYYNATTLGENPGCQNCAKVGTNALSCGKGCYGCAMPYPYKCGDKYSYSPRCTYLRKGCENIWERLMTVDKARLYALCEENFVKVYDIDPETGRLTPKNKEKLCRRLARRLEKNGKSIDVVLA